MRIQFKDHQCGNIVTVIITYLGDVFINDLAGSLSPVAINTVYIVTLGAPIHNTNALISPPYLQRESRARDHQQQEKPTIPHCAEDPPGDWDIRWAFSL